MPSLRFWVEGTPIPQGSKVAAVTKAGRPYLRDVNSHALNDWRKTVRNTVRDHMAVVYRHEGGIDVPVMARMTFWLPRPKNRPKTIDVLPAVMPDVDKLARAVMDALTQSGLIKDDAIVWDMHPIKRYAIDPDLYPKIFIPEFHRAVPGVDITVAWRSV